MTARTHKYDPNNGENETKYSKWLQRNDTKLTKYDKKYKKLAKSDKELAKSDLKFTKNGF